MWVIEHPKLSCEYCGRGLMPIKHIDWDSRKYHKKCFLKLKKIQEMMRLHDITLEEEKRRNQLLEKLKPSMVKVYRMDYC